MRTRDSYMARLRRHKRVMLGLAALVLVGVEVYYYMRGVPLVDDVIDWLIGMAIATILIEIYFRMTARLQRRLQAEIIERERAEKELEERVAELREAFDQIKILRGLIPICASCKKMRDDRGYWHQVEVYLSQHSELTFSHGLCPDCFKALYPEFCQDTILETGTGQDVERPAAPTADQ